MLSFPSSCFLQRLLVSRLVFSLFLMTVHHRNLFREREGSCLPRELISWVFSFLSFPILVLSGLAFLLIMILHLALSLSLSLSFSLSLSLPLSLVEDWSFLMTRVQTSLLPLISTFVSFPWILCCFFSLWTQTPFGWGWCSLGSYSIKSSPGRSQRVVGKYFHKEYSCSKEKNWRQTQV